MHPDPAAGTLTVRLLHQTTRAQDRALAPFARATQPLAYRLSRRPPASGVQDASGLITDSVHPPRRLAKPAPMPPFHANSMDRCNESEA